MNLIKVYDKNGKHVDSFRHSIEEGKLSIKVAQLNANGFYTKKQLGKDGKPKRSY